MRILCFIDCLGSGGAQRQMTELAKGFSERGHEVGFLVYHHNGFYDDILSAANIPVEVVDEKSYVKRFIRIRRYIRKGGFDTVLSFLPSPNTTACLSGLPFRKWRLVIGERNADPGIMKSVTGIIKLWSYVFADFIASNSVTNMEMVIKAVPLIRRKKTAVIYNIVDFARFRLDEKHIYRKNGFFTIIVAARLSKQKNLDGLIEGVNLLSAGAKEQLRIEWYGDSDEGDTLGDRLKKISGYGLDGIFKFYPAVKDIENKIADADAVGLFSLHEGLPNAVCEGMAMGKPVIASAVSDVPRLISEKRLLCDPSDHRSIADALEYILSLTPQEMERIGNENQKRALELFDKNRIINQYLNVLLP